MSDAALKPLHTKKDDVHVTEGENLVEDPCIKAGLGASETDKQTLLRKEVTGHSAERFRGLENVPDSSIDSGIYDVVIKQEPVDALDRDQTVGETETTGNIDLVIKQEPDDYVSQSTNSVNQMESNSDVEAGKESAGKSTEQTMHDKEEISDKDDAGLESDQAMAENYKVSAKAQKGESSCDKVNTVNTETYKNTVEDPECIVVKSIENGTLMDYRTSQKVITVVDSSDSSPDSSDSEDDEKTTKSSAATNTETQINKIVSNGRGESPDRERRVKLNRHGFEDIRTKGELLPEDLPPLEELTITVDDSVVMIEVGKVKSVVGILVVIQSNENIPPLDEDSILFLEGHIVLGQVFETFGPVKTPWYSVRFNQLENIKAKGVKEGMPVYCAPREDSFTKFVFTDSLKNVKGSDASWEDNNEPPEKHLDYSDDESERRAKAKQRGKKVADTEGGDDDDETTVQKKNKKNRNRNRASREHQGHLDGQMQSQQQKRAWNPFQGNHNFPGDNCHRFGSRNQNNQRWTSASSNFPRPAQRFGAPPNFRPRFRPMGEQVQAQGNFAAGNTSGSNNRLRGTFQQGTFTSPPPQFDIRSPPPPFIPGNLANPSPSLTSGNMQTPPPTFQSVNMQPHSNQGPAGGSVNVDFSRPPPPSNINTSFGQSNQQASQNLWNRQPFGVNQQNVPMFTATPLRNMPLTRPQQSQNQTANISNFQHQSVINGSSQGNQPVVPNQLPDTGNQAVGFSIPAQNWQPQNPFSVSQAGNQSSASQPCFSSQFMNGAASSTPVSSSMNSQFPAYNQTSVPSGSPANSSSFSAPPQLGQGFGQQSWPNISQNFQQGAPQMAPQKKTFQVHSLNPTPGDMAEPSALANNRSYENISVSSFSQQSYRPQLDGVQNCVQGVQNYVQTVPYGQNNYTQVGSFSSQTGSYFRGVSPAGTSFRPSSFQGSAGQ